MNFCCQAQVSVQSATQMLSILAIFFKHATRWPVDPNQLSYYSKKKKKGGLFSSPVVVASHVGLSRFKPLLNVSIRAHPRPVYFFDIIL